jgi:hypothetical protein
MELLFGWSVVLDPGLDPVDGEVAEVLDFPKFPTKLMIADAIIHRNMIPRMPPITLPI